MKLPGMTSIFISAILSLTGCQDLINGMDSHERLSASETGQVFTEFVGLNLNESAGALTIAPAADSSGMNIALSSSSSCMTMTGATFIPYSGATWQASLALTLNDCTASADGTVFNGTIEVSLSGPQGSVSAFDFSGTLKLDGENEGRLVIDLQYDITDCVINLSFDCWEGSINGYSIDEIRDAL